MCVRALACASVCVCVCSSPCELIERTVMMMMMMMTMREMQQVQWIQDQEATGENLAMRGCTQNGPSFGDERQ